MSLINQSPCTPLAPQPRSAGPDSAALENQTPLPSGEADLERRQLRLALAQAPAAMGILTGPDHRWTFVNNMYVRVTGRLGPEDFVGKTLLESLPELAGQSFNKLMDEAYNSGETYTGREVLARLNRGPHGESVDAWFDFIYQPLRNSSGQVDAILVHAIDVTAQVVARNHIEEAHQRLRTAHIGSQRLVAIIESSDDAIISKDLNSIVTTWNEAAQRMFGYTAEEMIGQSILRVIPTELRYEEDEILSKLRAGERIEHYETTRQKKSGETFDVSVSISPLKDDSGNIIGASKIARDISDRKRVERLVLQSEKLAATGRMAAAIAHEINNPLESLINVIFLAKQYSQPDSKTHTLLTTAEAELERVAHIARQTLGYYKDTSSPIELHLHDLIENILTVYNSKMLASGIRVETLFNDMQRILVSKGEMLQIFSNIIANAIDAMPHGGVLNIAARNVRGDARDGIQVTVRDSGTGILPENVERVFEPFFTTKGNLGTGIGLWVAKQLVEGRGGQISLVSSTAAKNSGTTATIFIPFAQPVSRKGIADSLRN
jgi:PAS domain S-box-containing protein